MELDNFLEEWPESLDIFGSVLMGALGVSREAENWSVCLNLVELMCLDLLGHMDFLLEHRAVCFNLLGPLFSDDPFAWMFLYIENGL